MFSDYKFGKEVKQIPLDENDVNLLSAILQEYSSDIDVESLPDISEFTQLVPNSVRPYGRLYAY